MGIEKTASISSCNVTNNNNRTDNTGGQSKVFGRGVKVLGALYVLSYMLEASMEFLSEFRPYSKETVYKRFPYTAMPKSLADWATLDVYTIHMSNIIAATVFGSILGLMACMTFAGAWTGFASEKNRAGPKGGDGK